MADSPTQQPQLQYLLLLGAPTLLRDGQPIAFRTRKALALLCYLAVSPGPHPRERLLTLLWPNADERRGRANLRTALLYLRTALGPSASQLRAEGDRLAIAPSASAPSALDVDVHALEVAYGLGADHTPSGDGDTSTAIPAAVVAQLARAATLYRGPFLDGLALPDAPEFEAWMESQRAWWMRRARLIYLRLASLQRERGAPEDAAEALEHWLRYEPSDEGVWQALLTLYGEVGDSAAVRDAYARCRAALRAAYNAEPDARTRALAQAAEAEAAKMPLASEAASEVESEAATEAAQEDDNSSGTWQAGMLPLVGRGREVAALHAAYRRAAVGHPSLALLLGQAGIGKTRLVRELAKWATAHGGAVLMGRAFAAGAELPYAPLTAALRERLERENAPDDLLPDVWLTELARLLPELRERYPDLPPPLADVALVPVRLFEAVARLLGALADRAPLLLILDDAQWADAGTRDLMRYLVRGWGMTSSGTAGAHVLVVVAARTEDAGMDIGLSEWIEALARDATDDLEGMGGATRLYLGPLGRSETLRLTALLAGQDDGARPWLGKGDGAVGAVGAVVDSADEAARLGDWLYARTGGQPFYLAETLRELLETGAIGLRASPGGGWALDLAALDASAALAAPLPGRVQESILARLRRLNSRTVALLRAGAILGGSFGFGTACQVATLDEEAGLAALDEARLGLLLSEVGDIGDSTARKAVGMEAVYEFGHDLVREVVARDAGEARRTALHRRALRALEDKGAPAAELARHALEAGESAAAFHYSLQAGHDSLAIFAVQDSIAHYERARGLLERGVKALPGERVFLYANLGRAYDATDARGAARSAYEQLRASGRRAVQPALAAEALNLYLTRAGLHFDEARVLLEEALLLDASAFGPAAEAETRLNVAQVAVVAWNLDVAAREAERALAIAHAQDLAELAGRSSFLLALVALWTSRYDDARIQCVDASTTFHTLRGRGTSAAMPLQPLWAGAPRTLSSSDESHLRVMEAHCYGLLACVEVNRGEAAAGRAAGYAGLRLAEEAHDDWGWGLIAVTLAIALVEGGEYAEARRVEKRASEIARALPIINLRPSVPLWSGMTHLALLDLARARTAILEALHAPVHARATALEALRLMGPEVSSTHLWRVLGLSRLCATHVLAGEWGEAATYARAATEARERMGRDLLPVDFSRHYETEALLRDGDAVTARRDVARLAARIGVNLRHRLVLTRMQVAIARWESDVAGAAARLEESLELASRLELPGERWQILAELAALHGERGEAAEAARRLVEAQAIAERLAERLGDTEQGADFLARALIRIMGQAITPI